MRYISFNFKRSEFACKCGCGFDTIDAETLQVLQSLRQHFNRPVTINSGCRCEEYNKKQGGAKNSQHLLGRAADFTVKGIQPKEVQSYLKIAYPGKYGVGSYGTFTHLDTRTNGPARW